MSDHVKTLECGGCGVWFENEKDGPVQIRDGLCHACARPRLLEENEQLRGTVKYLETAVEALEVGNKPLPYRELEEKNEMLKAEFDKATDAIQKQGQRGDLLFEENERRRAALQALLTAVTFGPEEDLNPEGDLANPGYHARVPIGFVQEARKALAAAATLGPEKEPK